MGHITPIFLKCEDTSLAEHGYTQVEFCKATQ